MKRSQPGAHVLGLDVGAVSLSAAEIDCDGATVRTFYELHHGDVKECLEGVLASLDLSRINGVAATNSTPSYVRADRRFNDQISLISAGRRFYPDARSILVVGGERFGLVRFDADGAYLSFKANPLCAAGTGSFLDQQAQRLNLDGIQGLTALALANSGPAPKIASRCAVFAKTDLVHAQQEGHGLEAICDGLCRGVAKNIVDTLFTGETIHGPVLMVGGVAKNPAVVRHLRDMLELEMVVDGELPHGAAGAALERSGAAGESPIAQKTVPSATVDPGSKDASDRTDITSTVGRGLRVSPLEIHLSDYPDFESLEKSVFEGRIVEHSHPLEVDLYRELEAGADPQGLPGSRHRVHQHQGGGDRSGGGRPGRFLHRHRRAAPGGNPAHPGGHG